MSNYVILLTVPSMSSTGTDSSNLWFEIEARLNGQRHKPGWMNEWMKSFILLSYTTFINENSNSQNVIKMLSRYFSIEMHELRILFQFVQCKNLKVNAG